MYLHEEHLLVFTAKHGGTNGENATSPSHVPIDWNAGRAEGFGRVRYTSLEQIAFYCKQVDIVHHQM